jgi:hypothetical protein
MKRRAATHLARSFAGGLLAALLGGTAAFAQAPAVSSTAANVTAPSPAAADIRDIRGPEPIAAPWLWAICATTGVLLTSGAYFAWRWNQRRRLTAVKLPYEMALERLEVARALMRPNSVRLFSISVSDIVRLYIEQRFQVRAAHRTTEEFLYDLLVPSDALLASQRSLLAGFLNHCDLAKFGGWALSPQDMERMYRSARSFVLATGRGPLTSMPIRTLVPPSAEKDTYDSVSSA